MNAREQRGMQIADAGNIVKKSHVYVVPSQNEKGVKYTVALGKEPYCSCPDFENGNRCKHIYACEVIVSRTTREEHLDGSVSTTTESVTIKRTTYRQNWPAYDRAQNTEKGRFHVLLHDLCRN